MDIGTEVAPQSLPGDSAPFAALRSTTGVALIGGTFVASLVAFVDASVVNVAVPAIGRRFDARVSELQWTLTGYLLTAAAFLLLAGALADHFGRRRVLEIGLVVMLVASILCTIAPSLGTLIAARALQGCGAALVVPTSLALLNGTLRPQDRARGIGIWAGLSTLGTSLGPYVGGALVDHASWRWVFLLNVPLVFIALLALRRVPETNERRPLSVDILGAVLTVVGLSGVIYGLSSGTTIGWTSARVVGALAVGGAAIIALVPVERRMRAPMLRLSLFASRQFDAINVSTILFYGALSAASYLLVLQCELRLGYSAEKAGAVSIPTYAMFLVLAPISGVLVARLGVRWLMSGGILLVASAILFLSRLHPGASYVGSVLPGVLLWGLGIGLAVAPLTAAVLAAVADSDLGEASAVNDASARVGALIMIAVVPALIGAGSGHALGASLTDGYRPAMLAVAAICAAAAVIAAVFVTDGRTAATPIATAAPYRGCALPVPGTDSADVAAEPVFEPSDDATLVAFADLFAVTDLVTFDADKRLRTDAFSPLYDCETESVRSEGGAPEVFVAIWTPVWAGTDPVTGFRTGRDSAYLGTTASVAMPQDERTAALLLLVTTDYVHLSGERDGSTLIVRGAVDAGDGRFRFVELVPRLVAQAALPGTVTAGKEELT